MRSCDCFNDLQSNISSEYMQLQLSCDTECVLCLQGLGLQCWDVTLQRRRRARQDGRIDDGKDAARLHLYQHYYY